MKKKVYYLFSRNHKIGSKLISWGSSLYKEDVTELNNSIPSHVAVLFGDCLVIESTLATGVRIIPYNKWLEHNEQLYKLECPHNFEMLEEKKKDLLFEMWGKKYDWFGILYFVKCMINKYLFNTKLPETNKWEREDYFFCTEFAGRMSDYNYSMTTPAKMCNYFLKKSNGKT